LASLRRVIRQVDVEVSIVLTEEEKSVDAFPPLERFHLPDKLACIEDFDAIWRQLEAVDSQTPHPYSQRLRQPIRV
jgi:hypothetical protein